MVYVVHVVTQLGRELPETDWRGIHRDAILYFLYRMRTSLLNPNNAPPEVTALMDATGLEESAVQELCNALVAAGLAESRDGSYAITQQGIDYVEETRTALLGS